MFEKKGFKKTSNVDDADLIILNTCHIREKAVEKVYSELGRLKSIKKPEASIAVGGCVAQAEGVEISLRAQSVDFVFGPQNYHKLPSMLARAASQTGKKNTQQSIIETEFPCRIKKFELIPGSGGDGKFRGGLAIRREYEMLQPGMVIFRGDRAVRPPLGVCGGKPGRPSSFVLNPGKPNERKMPITTRIDLEKGDTMRIEAAGGGGYGDPVRRNPEIRKTDEREGYTTRQTEV